MILIFGLSKKVSELSILCDDSAFVIIYSPDDTKPMMWSIRSKLQEILMRFHSMPEIEPHHGGFSGLKGIPENNMAIALLSLDFDGNDNGSDISQGIHPYRNVECYRWQFQWLLLGVAF
ncbi:hypothetical protein LWI28_015355 [Acer negundo]|uniref:MADS-box domain-containing protein n=1 Tax=Acer negundo TaxID=4023 RepID=A0AAD5NQM1_ACENE|nr:hypothetical protein LWI28_015355 [Acer negundo]